jgi:hypothetical protein
MLNASEPVAVLARARHCGQRLARNHSQALSRALVVVVVRASSIGSLTLATRHALVAAAPATCPRHGHGRGQVVGRRECLAGLRRPEPVPTCPRCRRRTALDDTPTWPAPVRPQAAPRSQLHTRPARPSCFHSASSLNAAVLVVLFDFAAEPAASAPLYRLTIKSSAG